MGRFILIDHALVDCSGHHYQYARAVLDAALTAAYSPVLVTNRRFKTDAKENWPIVPAYKFGVWLHQGASDWQVRVHRTSTAIQRQFRRAIAPQHHLKTRPEDQPRSSGFLRTRIEAGRRRRFTKDTARLAQQLGIAGDDLVFLPTVSRSEIDALARFWRTNCAASRAAWHLLFLRSPETMFVKTGLIRSPAFNITGRQIGPRRLHFWTDSDELAARYRELTGLNFGTLPIPHAASARVGRPPAQRLRVLFLGDARLEKGFQHLPRLVRSLTGSEESRRRFEFCFQAHSVSPCEESEIAAARAELNQMTDRGVTLLTAPLTPEGYQELLASGHIVVLPYDKHAYAERSSGVFAEALGAGIPVVAPESTWMARQLPQGTGLAFHSLDELEKRVQTIAAEYPSFSHRAGSGADAWRAKHNADRLVSLLCSPMAGTARSGGELARGFCEGENDLVLSRIAR